MSHSDCGSIICSHLAQPLLNTEDILARGTGSIASFARRVATSARSVGAFWPRTEVNTMPRNLAGAWRTDACSQDGLSWLATAMGWGAVTRPPDTLTEELGRTSATSSPLGEVLWLAALLSRKGRGPEETSRSAYLPAYNRRCKVLKIKPILSDQHNVEIPTELEHELDLTSLLISFRIKKNISVYM